LNQLLYHLPPIPTLKPLPKKWITQQLAHEYTKNFIVRVLSKWGEKTANNLRFGSDGRDIDGS
jgi:hypothetical protein